MQESADALIGRVSVPLELFTVTLIEPENEADEPAWLWLPMLLEEAVTPVAAPAVVTGPPPAIRLETPPI